MESDSAGARQESLAGWVIELAERGSAPTLLSSTLQDGRGELLDGDGLGEVAGFVHVAASGHGDVVGDELEREGVGDDY